jgi:hypothetical protein
VSYSCEICGNVGVLERDEKLYECECAELRRIAASMPAFVRTVLVKDAHIQATLPGTKIRITDAIDKSLYITAYWDDMRAFIKLVMLKYRNKYVRVISDRELRDVFVGATSKSSRGENSKDPIYNSIEDLVKPPTLLIIRLNELGYKNKAAAGILEEAICYRLDRGMPLWLLSNSARPFSNSSYAYSETVWSLITSLTKFRIEPISQVDISIESNTLSLEQAPSLSSPKLRSPKNIRNDNDDDLGGLSIFGTGVKSPRRL